MPERVECIFKYAEYIWLLTALAPVFLILTSIFNRSKLGNVVFILGKLYFALYFGIIEVLITGRDLDDVYEASKNRGKRGVRP